MKIFAMERVGDERERVGETGIVRKKMVSEKDMLGMEIVGEKE